LRAFPVLVPPLSQQSKIVEILSAGDDAIVRTKRLIAAQQTRKKGIMQRLLTGHIRFLGFGGEWARVHLREVFQRNIRRAGNRIVENVLSITASVGFVDQREKFGKVIAGKNIANYILLKHGEFAYNRGNSNAYPQGCIYMLEEFDEGAIPSVYYSFVATSNKVYPPFYKHYFESGALNGQLMRYISSSVRADGLFNISADNFFNILIPLPSLDEQIKITEILTTCDIEIDLQKRKLALLKSQKKGLMQRLLTGELRVKLD
jgi:type I restriction enzyme S subunit